MSTWIVGMTMMVTGYGKFVLLLLIHFETVSNELTVVKYSRTSGALPTTVRITHAIYIHIRELNNIFIWYTA